MMMRFGGSDFPHGTMRSCGGARRRAAASRGTLSEGALSGAEGLPMLRDQYVIEPEPASLAIGHSDSRAALEGWRYRTRIQFGPFNMPCDKSTPAIRVCRRKFEPAGEGAPDRNRLAMETTANQTDPIIHRSIPAAPHARIFRGQVAHPDIGVGVIRSDYLSAYHTLSPIVIPLEQAFRYDFGDRVVISELAAQSDEPARATVPDEPAGELIHRLASHEPDGKLAADIGAHLAGVARRARAEAGDEHLVPPGGDRGDVERHRANRVAKNFAEERTLRRQVARRDARGRLAGADQAPLKVRPHLLDRL